MTTEKFCSRHIAFKNLVPGISRSSCPRQCLRVRAEDDRKQKGIDFTPRTGKNTGYLEEDSAGQPNIFAVESKSFLAGSSKDQGTMSGANAAIAGVAAAVAALAIVGGILVTKDKGQTPVVEKISEVPNETLSSISKRIGPIKKAVQEAPAVAQDAAESAANALQ